MVFLRQPFRVDEVYSEVPSFRFARPALLALVVGAAFSAGFCLRAQGQDDAFFDLGTYRVALEQLRAGRPQNAQLLLEASQKPLASENALLLAYLQDANGQSDEARKTLSAVTTPSPLASAYLRRLGGTPAQTQTGATNQSGLVGPALQPVASLDIKNSARLPASDARLSKLEAYMVNVVNDEREKHGLARLQNDPALAEVARAHSAEMRDKKYFNHESPTRALHFPLDRYVAAFGTTPHIIAENIYQAWDSHSLLTQEETLKAHTALMNSPHHRENLMDPRVTRIGIGFSTDATGNLWITQMFSLVP